MKNLILNSFLFLLFLSPSLTYASYEYDGEYLPVYNLLIGSLEVSTPSIELYAGRENLKAALVSAAGSDSELNKTKAFESYLTTQSELETSKGNLKEAERKYRQARLDYRDASFSERSDLKANLQKLRTEYKQAERAHSLAHSRLKRSVNTVFKLANKYRKNKRLDVKPSTGPITRGVLWFLVAHGIYTIGEATYYHFNDYMFHVPIGGYDTLMMTLSSEEFEILSYKIDELFETLSTDE